MVTAENATCTGLHRWATEASTIGLAPGAWPERIETTLGNGQPFVKHAERYDEDQFIGCFYKQMLGCIILNVFND